MRLYFAIWCHGLVIAAAKSHETVHTRGVGVWGYGYDVKVISLSGLLPDNHAWPGRRYGCGVAGGLSVYRSDRVRLAFGLDIGGLVAV